MCKRLLASLFLVTVSCLSVSCRPHRGAVDSLTVAVADVFARGVEWKEGERLAVWSDADSLVTLTCRQTGRGRDAAFRFACDSFVFRPGTAYHAVYPCPGNMSAVRIPSGDVRTLYGAAEVEGGAIRFVLRPVPSVLRMQLSLPATDSIGRAELVPLSGTVPSALLLDGRTGALAPADSVGRLSLPLETGLMDSLSVSLALPAVLPDAPSALLLHGRDRLYTIRVEGRTPAPGDSCLLAGAAVPLDATLPSRIEVEEMPQTQIRVPSGEYSGITYLENGMYAAVHDKSAGGGIWFFRIPLDGEGNVGEVRAFRAAGTGGGAASRDAEGIAAASGTLFVSMEADQSIREFDLEGNPTGRRLAVPDDLARDRIAANKGFEALSCQPGLDALWTVTEGPLLADKEWLDGRMLRLQRFSLTSLLPSGRYFYRMDAPTASASGCQAYVHGVSALAALPDGRLLVLEREVRVPNGGFFEKLTGSFSRTKVFAVDPARDPAGVLSKSPVADFSCGALGLADFEGMCLGPALPDGSVPLLLLSDSQNGMGGLVQEYVKVLKLKL